MNDLVREAVRGFTLLPQFKEVVQIVDGRQYGIPCKPREFIGGLDLGGGRYFLVPSGSSTGIIYDENTGTVTEATKPIQ